MSASQPDLAEAPESPPPSASPAPAPLASAPAPAPLASAPASALASAPLASALASAPLASAPASAPLASALAPAPLASASPAAALPLPAPLAAAKPLGPVVVDESARLESVDLVRGVIMVLMALDHTRDFFHAGASAGDPERLAHPGLALFFTRWVTHFCAPTFVFLAGAAAALSAARGKPPRALASFLWKRGLWLVLLEFTLVRFGWTFDLRYHFAFVQVIWVLGVSMIALAALVFLPRAAIGAFGALLVLGHNAFDAIGPGGLSPAAFAGTRADVSALGPGGTLWAFLHVPGNLRFSDGFGVAVRYPLVPWVGIMALGYALGPLLTLPPGPRRRALVRLGGALSAAFVALRALNLYGDPRPWAPREGAAETLIAFLNVQKYPPSLLFTLMTLGPLALALAFAERWRGPSARFFVTFGRVPLFFYLLHLPLIHVLVFPAALVKYGPAVAGLSADRPPPDWGWSLPVVYAVCVGVVLALYLPCRWFAGVKARRRDPWLSYF